MNRRYQMAVIGSALLLAAGATQAQQARPFAVSNSLHVEYDDNIDQTKADKIASWKVSDQLTLSYSRVLETGFLGLRYTGVGTWWDKREENEFTLDHHLDAEATLRLSRRLEVGAAEKFIRRDSPELLNADGTVKRADASYDYNSLNAFVRGRGRTTSLDVAGRWQFLRYDEDRIADREDHDMYSAGATLRNQATRDTALLLEVRGEQYDYPGAGKATPTLVLPGLTPAAGDDLNTIPDRSFTSLIAGFGVEQKFSPNLAGRATLGYMKKDLDAANASDDSAPYADAALTVTPSPATTITLAGAYSLYQSGVLTYASQERTSASLSLGHDLNPRLTVVVAGSYVNSDYQAANSVDTVAETSVRDGSEDIWVFSTRLVHRVDRARRHSVEAGWSHTNLSSDLREDFSRNRYDASWRIQL